MPTLPRLLVTAATGQLGRLVVDALLGLVPAERIVAGVRDPAGESATAIRSRGIELRIADYSRPDTLGTALAGIDRLLLISGSELGRRTEQHRNVIDAAKHAGVELIAYTSILRADRSPLFLAAEHLDTETALAAAGVPFVLLRNGWYNEVFTWRLPLALREGVLRGATGTGRISAAARADYALAAATVLAGTGHAGRTYELAGDHAFTLPDLAAIVAEASGEPFPYQDMTPDAFQAAALAAGVPEPFARILSDTDAGTAEGALFDDGGALSRLIGRPTTPVRATITGFLRDRAPHDPAPAHHT